MSSARLLYADLTVEHLARVRPELYEEWGIYMTDERPSGTVPEEISPCDVRLDGWQLDRKVTALTAMMSQTADVMATMNPDVYAKLVGEETFVDASLASHMPRA